MENNFAFVIKILTNIKYVQYKHGGKPPSIWPILKTGRPKAAERWCAEMSSFHHWSWTGDLGVFQKTRHGIGYLLIYF